MPESKPPGCAKVMGTLVVILLVVGGVLGGAGWFVWERWGKDKMAELKAETEEEMAMIEAGKNMPKRPVVSSATIQADQGIYDKYNKRDDVLVMVFKNVAKLPPVQESAGKASGGVKAVEGEAGKIVPMKGDWLPPGVTRD